MVEQSEGVAGPESGPVELAYEKIARLAYSYWLERQETGKGSAEEDWFRAERELRG